MSTLDNLRKSAKRWLKALRANDHDARERLRRAYPKAPAAPGLRDVQHALAREHGHESWTALKDAVALRQAQGTAVPAGRDHAKRVASFLKDASLDWRTGGSLRTAARHTADRLLRRYPEIARDSIYTAVVCGDLDEVERVLAQRPQAASEQGGPRAWPPLLYLCSARLSLPAASENALAIAQALLDRGADPNAYSPGGSPTIHYTALTCAIGEGEENAPRHPQFEALTRLLLERGAEPYDKQVLYNTHFRGDILWLLKLMYARAVTLGRRADWDDPDWSMLDMGGYGCGARYLLGTAVDKNDLELAEWILAHGANPNPPPAPHPSASKRTLHEEALRLGHVGMAELLVRYGATPSVPVLEGVEAFAAACFRLDRKEAQALLAQHPEYLRSPVAMFAAAKRDRAEVVAFLLDLGVSVDVEDAHGTRALHEAAYGDASRTAALLIERGAEVDPRESTHGKTPLGWAVYGRRARTIELLGRVSRDVFQLTWTGNVERLRDVLRAEPELAKIVDDGHTPLMWLPDDEARAVEIVELFLAHGADPSLRTTEGQTAADYARKRGLDEAASKLAASAADLAPKNPPPSAEGDGLQRFESLARDLLIADDSGEPAALRRLSEQFGTWLTWDDLRARVRERLDAVPASERPAGDFALAHARLVIARSVGFTDWTELVNAFAGNAPSRPAFVVDSKENRIKPRRALVANDWDTLIEVMKERRIPALDAEGQMTDGVLERLSHLGHVTGLYLGGSRHVTDAGLRHLARMPQLQHLDLTGCSITDRGLEVLRQLPALRTFAIYHHGGITDAGVMNLSDCHHLERVALMGTRTGDGAIGALAGKAQLRVFQAGREFTETGLALLHEFPAFKTWQGGELRYALMEFEAGPNYLLLHPSGRFGENGLASLAGLDGLFALNLDNPAWKGADLAPLLGLPHLGWLGHDCDDDAMRQIAAMPHLRMLMCQDTEAGDEGFTALSRSASLEYIWGRRCYNLRERGFAALSRMPALRGLAVSCRNVDDDALSSLPRFPALRAFMPMDVQDAGFRHVGRCERLEELWCMYCRDTTDAATEHIAGLSRLKTYYAGRTRITDRSLEILGRMASLENVRFWSCAGVTDAGLKFLARLPRLREVDLHGLPNVTREGTAVFPAHVRVDYSS